MTSALYVAAKAPRVGLAKTRLGAAIGHEAAVALYRAFLADIANRFAAAELPINWYVTPADAWADLAPICCPDGRPARVLDQGDGDWTARQRRLFAGMPARGEQQLVLTASDSPHLPVAHVRDAFHQLETHDLVLGPVHDGGYYLIGVRAGVDVLDGIAMSTATVFDQIVARARELGHSVGFVEGLIDVDEAADLPRLADALERADDCPATRAALKRWQAEPASGVQGHSPTQSRVRGGSPGGCGAAPAQGPRDAVPRSSLPPLPPGEGARG